MTVGTLYLVENPNEPDVDPAPSRYVIVVTLELVEAEALALKGDLSRRVIAAVQEQLEKLR